MDREIERDIERNREREKEKLIKKKGNILNLLNASVKPLYFKTNRSKL